MTEQTASLSGSPTRRMLLANGCALALAGCAGAWTDSPRTAPGIWVGDGAPFGALFVELRLGAGACTLTILGDAGDGFDAGYPTIALPVAQTGAGTLSFAGRSRGRPLNFQGAAQGSVAQGALTIGDRTYHYRLVRLRELHPEIVGLYSGDGRKAILTWREQAGLRLIDVERNTSTTLLPVDGGFLTPAQLGANFAPPRFTIDIQGAATAMVIDAASDPTQIWRRRTAALTQERVVIPVGGDRLAGTLMRPATRPRGVIVFVHGSGPIYRTALIARAVHFVEAGYAALVYDKRGSGESSGERGDDLFLLADDAAAALAFVRRQGDLVALPVGFQGHSQAGWVIPLAVAARANPDFCIIINGGGISPGEQSLFDKQNDLTRAGVDEPSRREALSLLQEIQHFLRERREPTAELQTAFAAAQLQPWFDELDLPRLPRLPSWQEAMPEMMAESRELSIDPAALTASMTMPTLVLLGGADQTVPAEAAARAWTQSFAAHPSSRGAVHVLPGLTHSMRLEDGRLVPGYLSAQLEWLVQTNGDAR